MKGLHCEIVTSQKFSLIKLLFDNFSIISLKSNIKYCEKKAGWRVGVKMGTRAGGIAQQ